MNIKKDTNQKYQSIRITAGVFFIISAFLDVLSKTKFKYIFTWGQFLLPIALIIIGLGLLINNKVVSIVGCCTIFIYCIWYSYCASNGKNGFSTDAFIISMKSFVLRYVIPFLIMIITLILQNKISFFLSLIPIAIAFRYSLASNSYSMTLLKYLYEEDLSFVRYDIASIIEPIFLLLAFIIYSIYLFFILYKNNKIVVKEPVIKSNKSNQAEEVIEKIYQLKTLVDNNTISVQDYIATKQRILSQFFPSQQPVASTQPDSLGSNSRPFQTNISANQIPQYYQPPLPAYHYSHTFQSNISVNQYPGSNQPEGFSNQYSQSYPQQPNSSYMNPYPNPAQEPINNNDIDQKAN